jgi:hypothetical protein
MIMLDDSTSHGPWPWRKSVSLKKSGVGITRVEPKRMQQQSLGRRPHVLKVDSMSKHATRHTLIFQPVQVDPKNLFATTILPTRAMLHKL